MSEQHEFPYRIEIRPTGPDGHLQPWRVYDNRKGVDGRPFTTFATEEEVVAFRAYEVLAEFAQSEIAGLRERTETAIREVQEGRQKTEEMAQRVAVLEAELAARQDEATTPRKKPDRR